MRAAAETAGAAVIASLSPFAIDMVLPVLLKGLDLQVLWQSKVAAMQLLVALSKQAPEAVKLNLPTIVPVLTGCVCDAKRQVKVLLLCYLDALCNEVLGPNVQNKRSLLRLCIHVWQPLDSVAVLTLDTPCHCRRPPSAR